MQIKIDNISDSADNSEPESPQDVNLKGADC